MPCCTYTFVVFVNINSFCELDTPDTEDEVSHDPDVPSTVAVDTGNVHSSGDIVAVDGTGIQPHPPVCDIGLRPNGKLPDSFVEFWVERGSPDCQHMDANFSKSVQDNGKQKRWFSKSLSSRIDSLNGAKILRSWLCYLPMTGHAFCFACKLFTSHNDNAFAGVGYVDRKNAVARIEKHENMQSESSCCVSCIVQQSRCKKPSGQST